MEALLVFYPTRGSIKRLYTQADGLTEARQRRLRLSQPTRNLRVAQAERMGVCYETNAVRVGDKC